MPRRLTPAPLLALALACTSSDDAPSDTDATTASSSSSTTETTDDLPLDTTAGDGTDSDSGMTMGATDGPGSSSDDGPIGCMTDDDCTEAGAPFCVNMLCAPCSANDDPDAACAEKFPEMPACVASECVECSATVTSACTGTTPLCDAEANTCVGCTSHEECPDSACHIPYPDGAHATDQDGACFDPKAVVHVDGDGGMQFETIGEAVDSFEAGAEGVIIVHGADSSYDDAVVVNGDRMLAILAADGEEPVWQGSLGGGSQLSIEGSLTTVYLHRMRLSTNADPDDAAIHLQGGRVHIQRSQIVDNNGGGMEAESNALVHVENSFVGQQSDVVSVDVQSSSASIVYSTLVTSTFGSNAALSCNDAASMAVRNSIIVNQGGPAGSELACALDSSSGNATEADVGAFPAMPSDWFNDYGSGDFHLSKGGAGVFADLATWNTGDPLTDIDGEPRPTLDGTLDYAGADVP